MAISLTLTRFCNRSNNSSGRNRWIDINVILSFIVSSSQRNATSQVQSAVNCEMDGHFSFVVLKTEK